MGAGSQLFCGMEPIFIRRSVWAASRLPERISESRDVLMSERGDAMRGGSRLSMLMGVLGVLQGLARMLVWRQVILVIVLLGNAMGVRGVIV